MVTLEVPGRRSGAIRRTTLVQVTYDGAHHLVALAGESEWVRNVRAAGGRVVIGRRERHRATLIEVPTEDRAPIIRAYLLRAGRRAGSRKVANEARYYFGLSADPALAEIRRSSSTILSSGSSRTATPVAAEGDRPGASARSPASAPAEPSRTDSSQGRPS